MKGRLKRTLSIFLTLAMLLTMIPVVYAEDAAQPTVTWTMSEAGTRSSDGAQIYKLVGHLNWTGAILAVTSSINFDNELIQPVKKASSHADFNVSTDTATLPIDSKLECYKSVADDEKGAYTSSATWYQNDNRSTVEYTMSTYEIESYSVDADYMIFYFRIADGHTIDELDNTTFELRSANTAMPIAVGVTDANTSFYYAAKGDTIEASSYTNLTNVSLTYTNSDQVPKYVASVGETSYKSLQAAINAVGTTSGQTVTLTDDVTGSITIAAGQSLTLDLNGYTLTGAVTNNGTLTIKDSNENGTGAIANTSGTAVTNTGSLTVSSGSITGSITGSSYAVTNTGTVTVSDGQFTGGEYAIDNSGTLNVTGGKFKGTAGAITGTGTVNYPQDQEMSAAPNADGWYTVGAVAEKTVYATLENGTEITTMDAFIAAFTEDNTITLQQDIDLNIPESELDTSVTTAQVAFRQITIPTDKTVTLNLNGHNITVATNKKTYNGTSWSTVSGSYTVISNSGNLTINGTGTFTLDNGSSSKAVENVGSSGATLTMSSVTIDSAGYAVYNNTGCTITNISNCDLKGGAKKGVLYNYGGTVTEITGGSINSTYTATKLATDGGALFSEKAGKIGTISGVTITATWISAIKLAYSTTNPSVTDWKDFQDWTVKSIENCTITSEKGYGVYMASNTLIGSLTGGSITANGDSKGAIYMYANSYYSAIGNLATDIKVTGTGNAIATYCSNATCSRYINITGGHYKPSSGKDVWGEYKKEANATATLTLSTGNKTLTKIADSSSQYYGYYALANTATFYDANDAELKTVSIFDGQLSDPGLTPTKDATEQYSYTFVGWTTEKGSSTTVDFTAATFDADTAFYPVFTATVIHTVTFYGSDNTAVLQTSRVLEGQEVSYTGETPTKASDASTAYRFVGWATKQDATADDIVTFPYTVSGDTAFYPVFKGVQYTMKVQVQGSTTNFNADETFTVAIVAASNQESTFNSYGFTLDYDSEKLTLVQVENALSGGLLDSNTSGKVGYTVIGDGQTVSTGTTIATATFTVNAGASGENTIGLTDAEMTTSGYPTGAPVTTTSASVNLYDIQVTLSVSGSGTVSGSTEQRTLYVKFGQGDLYSDAARTQAVTLSTVAGTGHSFVGWYVNSNQIAADNTALETYVAALTASVEMQAVFTANTYAYNTVPTNVTMNISSGQATYGQDITFTVTPNSNCVLKTVSYTVDGQNQTGLTNNGDGSYTIPGEKILGNVMIYADAVQYHTVTFQAGAGTTIDATNTTAYVIDNTAGLYASTAALLTGDPDFTVPTVSASTGYRLPKDSEAAWSGNNGTTYLSSNLGSSLIVTSDVTLTALAIKTYNVTFAAGDNGSLENDLTQTVDVNTAWSAVTKPTPQANAGYVFSQWTVNATAIADGATITSDIVATANFIDGTYAITFPSVTGVSFTATGVTAEKVTHNTDVTFTMTVGAGKKVTEVAYQIDGGAKQVLTADNGVYTIPGSAITGAVSVTITSNNTYDVTFTAGEHGYVNGGKTVTTTFDENYVITAGDIPTVTADPGYVMDSWNVDPAGETVTETATYTVSFKDATYGVTTNLTGVDGVATQATHGTAFTFTPSISGGIILGATATINGNAVAVSKNTDTGEYTISGDAIIGDIAITFEYVNGTMEFIAGATYLDGLSNKQIVILKTEKLNGQKYTLSDISDFFWSTAYSGYVTIVDNTETAATLAANLSIIDGNADEITYSGDVNGTNGATPADSGIINDILHGVTLNYVPDNKMLLEMDVTGDKTVSTQDMSKILNIYLGK